VLASTPHLVDSYLESFSFSELPDRMGLPPFPSFPAVVLGALRRGRVAAMTEPVQRTSTESRCDACGTIRFTFDPPIELEESDEILLDEVWAVFRQLKLNDLWFSYIDSLFYTETSALTELNRQAERRAGVWESQHDFRFADGELLCAAKVNVRL
jgi:hypothetical protein